MSCPECPHCQARAVARVQEEAARDRARAAREAALEATPNGVCTNCGIMGRWPIMPKRFRLCVRCKTTRRETEAIEQALLSSSDDYPGEGALMARIEICKRADLFIAARGIGVAASDQVLWYAWPDFDEPYHGPEARW